ncbi:MAG: hypothetical protein ACREXS_11095 [Gammaproteobacteria bacterium]
MSDAISRRLPQNLCNWKVYFGDDLAVRAEIFRRVHAVVLKTD